MMDLPELVRELHRRRRMFALDDQYASLVSFIDGFALAQGVGMQEFQRWLVQRQGREPSSLHWGAEVAAQVRCPGELGALTGLTDVDQETASQLLLELLMEYLAREGVGEVS